MSWSSITPQLLRSGGAVGALRLTGIHSIVVDADRTHHLFGHRDGMDKLEHFTKPQGAVEWVRRAALTPHGPGSWATLALHDGALHLVLSGTTGMVHKVLERGAWRTLHDIPHYQSGWPVALSSHKGRLHMIHGGRNFTVYHSILEPGGWPTAWKAGRLRSYAPPTCAAMGDDLLIATTNNRGNVGLTEWTARAGTYRRLQALPHLRIQQGGVAIVARPNRQHLYLTAQIDKALPGNFLKHPRRTPQPSEMGFWRFDRGARGSSGSWSIRGTMPVGRTKQTPHLVESPSGIYSCHIGLDGQMIEGRNRNRSVASLRIAIKYARQIAPRLQGRDGSVETGLRRLFAGTKAIFESVGIDLRAVARPEEINLPPHLLDLSVGSCKSNSRTSEVKQITSFRNGMKKDDIAVYIVENVNKTSGADTLAGCAFPWAKACAMEPIFSSPLMAHEIGHVLGLNHVGDSSPPNVMQTPATPANVNFSASQAVTFARNALIR